MGFTFINFMYRPTRTCFYIAFCTSKRAMWVRLYVPLTVKCLVAAIKLCNNLRLSQRTSGEECSLLSSSLKIRFYIVYCSIRLHLLTSITQLICWLATRLKQCRYLWRHAIVVKNCQQWTTMKQKRVLVRVNHSCLNLKCVFSRIM